MRSLVQFTAPRGFGEDGNVLLLSCSWALKKKKGSCPLYGILLLTRDWRDTSGDFRGRASFRNHPLSEVGQTVTHHDLGRWSQEPCLTPIRKEYIQCGAIHL